jgi:hypothetical protein
LVASFSIDNTDLLLAGRLGDFYEALLAVYAVMEAEPVSPEVSNRFIRSK